MAVTIAEAAELWGKLPLPAANVDCQTPFPFILSPFVILGCEVFTVSTPYKVHLPSLFWACSSGAENKTDFLIFLLCGFLPEPSFLPSLLTNPCLAVSSQKPAWCYRGAWGILVRGLPMPGTHLPVSIIMTFLLAAGTLLVCNVSLSQPSCAAPTLFFLPSRICPEHCSCPSSH